jgi:hypothetical protein
MKTRSFALAAIAVLLLNAVGMSLGDADHASSKRAQAARLVSLLPASDGVVVFDARRFFDDAMPKVLAANQPLLAKITSHLNEIESRIGIDLRKFDQVAVGIAIKPQLEKDYDVAPVAIAGGDINAGALIGVAKLASKGKYREEKIGSTSVYIFTMPAAKTAATKTQNSTVAGAIHKGLRDLTTEIAAASLDRNTLAIGTPARVRETVEAKTHVSADISSLLLAKETAVMSFAVKPPVGVAKALKLDDDEFGANLNSIQYLSGSVEVTPIGTSLSLNARMAKPDQATSLKDTLEALQIIGKAALGSSKNPDQQVLGRMVKNAKFTAQGNDVTLDLLVPQADIDVLVAKIK